MQTAYLHSTLEEEKKNFMLVSMFRVKVLSLWCWHTHCRNITFFLYWGQQWFHLKKTDILKASSMSTVQKNKYMNNNWTCSISTQKYSPDKNVLRKRVMSLTINGVFCGISKSTGAVFFPTPFFSIGYKENRYPVIFKLRRKKNPHFPSDWCSEICHSTRALCLKKG